MREHKCAVAGRASEKAKAKLFKTIEMRLCRWHLSEKHKIYILAMPCARLHFFSFKCRHSRGGFSPLRHSTTFCMRLWIFKMFCFKFMCFALNGRVRGDCWNFSVDFSRLAAQPLEPGTPNEARGKQRASRIQIQFCILLSAASNIPKSRVFTHKKWKHLQQSTKSAWDFGVQAFQIRGLPPHNTLNKNEAIETNLVK